MSPSSFGFMFMGSVVLFICSANVFIDHDTLFCILEKYVGICGNALKLIKSYFSNRTQRVQIDNVLPDFANIICGVPQGSVLGPLKCCLYLLPLSAILRYNIAPPFLCELINKKESHVNTRLGTDHHQLIMPPISKDCSNTFLERSFIYADPCEWHKLSEHIRTSNFDCFRKSVKTMLFTQQYRC